MTTPDFHAAYTRLQSVTGTRTQIELATFLGIRQSSISDAKRRGEVPAGWLLKVLKEYHVNPEWIVTGDGPQYLEASDSAPAAGTVNRMQLEMAVGEVLNEATREITSAVLALMQRQENHP